MWRKRKKSNKKFWPKSPTTQKERPSRRQSFTPRKTCLEPLNWLKKSFHPIQRRYRQLFFLPIFIYGKSSRTKRRRCSKRRLSIIRKMSPCAYSYLLYSFFNIKKMGCIRQSQDLFYSDNFKGMPHSQDLVALPEALEKFIEIKILLVANKIP